MEALVFKSPYFLPMASKHNSSDAGNSDRPKRSDKVIPLCEKVTVLFLIGHFISLHHKKGEYNTIRYFKIETTFR